MSAAAADRNLLFGILALQMDFISRDALIQGMNAWVLDKLARIIQALRSKAVGPGHPARLSQDFSADRP
jgi:hypothetical protein